MYNKQDLEPAMLLSVNLVPYFIRSISTKGVTRLSSAERALITIPD